jgi:hypothetical protein
MSKNARRRLGIFASALLATLATAAIGVGSVLAGSGGPTIPH